MLTICWAAKGGSGTSVVAASLAIAHPAPSLLVDLDGDAPLILGMAPPDTPGFYDWLASDATTDRLAALETEVDPQLSLLHAGTMSTTPVSRWHRATAAWASASRHVVIDAGTRPPHRLLHGQHTVLVTRPCYLAINEATSYGIQPTQIVLVREPGHALRPLDIEQAIGAPVTSIIEFDPAVARRVDAGLLTGRLPGAMRRELRHVA